MDQRIITPINHFLAKYDPHIITICTFLFSAFFPFSSFLRHCCAHTLEYSANVEAYAGNGQVASLGRYGGAMCGAMLGLPPSSLARSASTTDTTPVSLPELEGHHSTTDTTPELEGHQLHISITGLIAPRRDSDTFWREKDIGQRRQQWLFTWTHSHLQLD